MAAQIRARPMYVLLEASARVIEVARHDSLGNFAVFDAHSPITRGCSQECSPVAVIQVQQNAAEADQHGHATPGDQGNVKLAMTRFPLLQRLGACGISDGAIELMQRAHDIALPLDITGEHCLAQGEDFELLSKPGDLFEIR